VTDELDTPDDAAPALEADEASLAALHELADEAETETVVEAVEEAAVVEEIADEAAAETIVEAAEEAAIVEEIADITAQAIVEDAAEQADALDAAGDHEAAEAVFEAGFEEAIAVEEAGDEAAEEILEEAVVEAAVIEAVGDEVAEEILEEAVEEVVAEELVVEEVEAAVVVAEAPEPEVAAADDPFRGPGDWYVVHTYAGYENKVKANLESRIHTMQMEGKIFRVHIPMEDVMEIKGGKKQVVQKKIFPGYLLVKMVYDNDSWYVVRNTPGVTGFVSAGTGTKPTPLSRREVEKILVVKKEEVKPAFRLGFEEGDVVRIISGPFADFNGTISEINVDQSKLKVLVNIFDRETPVELGFDQVSMV
jgi:transcription termination/antitermination protein NusG